MSTTTVICAVLAQNPAAGVKLYVVVAVLLIAGDQVPEMPLTEVPGRVMDPPLHTGVMGENWGSAGIFTTTVMLAAVAHNPGKGVKV